MQLLFVKELPLHFTDASTGHPLLLGAGTLAMEIILLQNPTHTYTTAFELMMLVLTVNGSANTETKTINIL